MPSKKSRLIRDSEKMVPSSKETERFNYSDKVPFKWLCLCGLQIRNMMKRTFKRFMEWLLEVEMGFVWGVAGFAIIMFVFAAIWYIDPALLTLVLRFRQARCITKNQAFLIGISNCSWTSCRLGCTREIYRCWQIQVEYEYVEGTQPYEPPWPSISIFNRGDLYQADYSDPKKSPSASTARLYPNVRGCGYPPELNCEEFYQTFKKNETDFPCWVSTTDTSVAITELDLERAKSEVLFSLIPLLIFIVFVLYAFCRMGVFAVCNPLKMCPDGPDSRVDLPAITPKKLLTYKRSISNKKSSITSQEPTSDGGGAADSCGTPSHSDQNGDGRGGGGGGVTGGVAIPATIMEEDPDASLMAKTSDGKQVVTSAQVLPRKVSLSSNSQRSLLLNEEMSLLEKEIFSKDKSSGDKSETNTIINDLFGEELERMDRERLASRYDVVDLKDLEDYRDILNRGRKHSKEEQGLSRRKQPQPQPRSPWNDTTDTQEDDEDFAKILAEASTSSKQTSIRAKHL